tara:strand:- start:5919 stop:7367 length:1449 start_codon:yes stop_codon:yes gene_type:complete
MKETIPLPEQYKKQIFFKKKSILTSPLKPPQNGETVYSLNKNQLNEIRSIRGEKMELDPGMGGVSPTKIRQWINDGCKLTSLDLMLTKNCNFSCTWCFAGSKPGEKESLSFDIIKNTVDQAANIGIKLFILTGGEPLMYRDSKNKKGFFDVVDYIQETYRMHNKEIKILVFDDVALITPKIARLFFHKNIALCTKADTLDSSLQDFKLQKKGAFDEMMRGYQNLWDAGYGKTKSPPIVVNTVLDHTTFDGIIDLHFWVREHGMDHSIVPVHYCGNALNGDQEGGIHSHHVKVLYDLLAWIDKEEFGETWTPWSAFPKNKNCNRNLSGLHIRSSGLVTACSESPGPDEVADYTFGNINEIDIETIANSEKLENYRIDFEKGHGKYVCNPDVCDLYKEDLCRGGCATRSAYSKIDYETGLITQNENRLNYSQFREDPLCPAWTVLAEKQGVLKAGLLDEVHQFLIKTSMRIYKEKYRNRVSLSH